MGVLFKALNSNAAGYPPLNGVSSAPTSNRRIQPDIGAMPAFSFANFTFPPIPSIHSTQLLLLHHHLQSFPFHILLVYAFLPPILFHPLPCPYNPLSPIWKNKPPPPEDAEQAVQLPNVQMSFCA